MEQLELNANVSVRLQQSDFLGSNSETVQQIGLIGIPDAENQTPSKPAIKRTRKSSPKSKINYSSFDIEPPYLYDRPIKYYFFPDSEIPVFSPDYEQFKDFNKFIKAIEPFGINSGLVKIVPPKEWRLELETKISRQNKFKALSKKSRASSNFDTNEPRKAPSSVERAAEFQDSSFPAFRPIVQHFDGGRGVFRQFNVEYFYKNLKLSKFLQLSEQPGKRPPKFGVERAPTSNKSKRYSPSSTIPSNGVMPSVPNNLPLPRISILTDSPSEEGIVVDYKNGKIKLSPKSRKILNYSNAYEKSKNSTIPPDINFTSLDQLTDDNDHVSEKLLSFYRETERSYWKNIMIEAPMYGADVPGTIFPPVDDFPYWNIRNLDSVLSRVKVGISGVTQPYLYLGMWKSTFSWHLEDMDLYSINYIHFGASKAWFSIPRKDFNRFQTIAQGAFASDYKKCKEFLRHKAFHLSPNYLASQGIKVNRVVHNAGEFMITFPYGYHSGYNMGFNLAESTNFALDRWIEIGKKANFCQCIPDSVKINMDEWFGDSSKKALLSSPPSPKGPHVNIVHFTKKRDSSSFSELESPSSNVLDTISKKRVRFFELDINPSIDVPNDTCSCCFDEIKVSGRFLNCVGCGIKLHFNCLPKYKQISNFNLGALNDNFKCASCYFNDGKMICTLCGTTGGILIPLNVKRLMKNRRASKRISETIKQLHFVHLHCSKAIKGCYLSHSDESINFLNSNSHADHPLKIENLNSNPISTNLQFSAIDKKERSINEFPEILSPKTDFYLSNESVQSNIIKSDCDFDASLINQTLETGLNNNSSSEVSEGISAPVDLFLGGMGYSIDGIENSNSIDYISNCSFCQPIDVYSHDLNDDIIYNNDGVHVNCSFEGCDQQIHPTCAAIHHLQNRKRVLASAPSENASLFTGNENVLNESQDSNLSTSALDNSSIHFELSPFKNLTDCDDPLVLYCISHSG
ncbi:DNA damage-responsive transcriptional repressor RPH1 [Smittium mucronatum]|uniref:DNA damage-responsive transcriptional repressor RPH1 n=1 Tax=Smittium mucronatum TaxID=133383 RepID=A0A1R0H4H9_9FUNG|nr:DNA damage-responsive transcriptional repressor RPH1 [Smittium mucronatum]